MHFSWHFSSIAFCNVCFEVRKIQLQVLLYLMMVTPPINNQPGDTPIVPTQVVQ